MLENFRQNCGVGGLLDHWIDQLQRRCGRDAGRQDPLGERRRGWDFHLRWLQVVECREDSVWRRINVSDVLLANSFDGLKD